MNILVTGAGSRIGQAVIKLIKKSKKIFPFFLQTIFLTLLDFIGQIVLRYYQSN